MKQINISHRVCCQVFSLVDTAIKQREFYGTQNRGHVYHFGLIFLSSHGTRLWMENKLRHFRDVTTPAE